MLLLPVAAAAQSTRPAVQFIVPFGHATAVDVSPDGTLFVADASINAVVRLDAAGAVLSTLGGTGMKEGEFDQPSGVDATNGLVIVVADLGNNRLQRFSRDGLFLGALAAQGDLDRPNGRADRASTLGRRTSAEPIRPVAVSVSPTGHIFAADTESPGVRVWDAAGKPLATIGAYDAGAGALTRPVDLSVAPDGTLYIADEEENAVLVYDTFSSYVRRIGMGTLPSIVSVAAGNEVFWVGGGKEVVVYSSAATRLAAWTLDIPDDLVDLATDGASLYVLTEKGLYYVRDPR